MGRPHRLHPICYTLKSIHKRMIISKQKKYIYIAVPKTGTVSVQKFLLDNDPSASKNHVEIDGKKYLFQGHDTAFSIKKKLGNHYDSFKVFGFVRNPFSRTVSSYFFYRKGAKEWIYKNKNRKRPLDQQVRVLLARILPFKVWAIFYPYTANYKFLADSDLRSVVTFIGRFEHLNTDLQEILRQIGISADVSQLPYANTSKHKTEKSYYGNGSFKKIMTWKMGKDIEFYNRHAALADRTGKQISDQL